MKTYIIGDRNPDSLQIDVAAMRNDKLELYMATPLYGQGVPEFHAASARQLNFMGNQGLNCRHQFERNMPLVALARNLCVARFLAMPEFTHLLFIDGDIEWGDVWEPVRMMAMNLPVLAGVYAKKNPDALTIPFKKYPGATPREDALSIEVSHAPTGFMMIRRDTFGEIINRIPCIKFETAAPELANIDPFLYAFFQDGKPEYSNRWRGEDIHFCDLCSRAGISVVADKVAVLRHHGQRFWECDPAKMLAELT